MLTSVILRALCLLVSSVQYSLTVLRVLLECVIRLKKYNYRYVLPDSIDRSSLNYQETVSSSLSGVSSLSPSQLEIERWKLAYISTWRSSYVLLGYRQDRVVSTC